MRVIKKMYGRWQIRYICKNHVRIYVAGDVITGCVEQDVMVQISQLTKTLAEKRRIKMTEKEALKIVANPHLKWKCVEVDSALTMVRNRCRYGK